MTVSKGLTAVLLTDTDKTAESGRAEDDLLGLVPASDKGRLGLLVLLLFTCQFLFLPSSSTVVPTLALSPKSFPAFFAFAEASLNSFLSSAFSFSHVSGLVPGGGTTLI